MANELTHKPLGRLAVVTVVIALLATALVVMPEPLGADTPSLTHECSLAPEHTPAELVGAGLPGVAAGETVVATNTVHLAEGDYRQHEVIRPDGSSEFTSLIELVALDDSVVFDPASIALTIDGTPGPLTVGAAPVADAWTLAADTTNTKTTWQVLFPADPTAVSTPEGAASITVPAEGITVTVSLTGTVAGGLTSGTVLPGVECFTRLATGEDTRDTDRKTSSLAVVDPHVSLVLDSNVAGGKLLAGVHFSYLLVATVPETHPEHPTRSVAAARDLAIVQQLPLPLHPVDADGLPLTDGEPSPSGGVWNQTDRTLTVSVDDVLPGETLQVEIPVMVNVDASPGAMVPSSATGTYSSLPGDVAGESTFSTPPAERTLQIASDAPTISKSAPVENYDRVRVLPYTLTVDLPADSTYENFAVSDVMPPSSRFRGWVSETCVDADGDPCAGFSPTRIATQTLADGSSMFAWNINHVPFSSKARTMTFVVNGDILPTVGDFGVPFENTAAVEWNVVDRLGVANPIPVAWPNYDGRVEATRTVTYNRPVLTVAKESSRPAKWDFDPSDNIIDYTVSITNSGSLPANAIEFADTTGRLDIDMASLTIDGGTCNDCSFDGTALRGTLSDLAPGDTITLTYAAVPTDAGTIRNSADIVRFADPEGTVYTDVVAASTASLIEEPALTITKTGATEMGGLVGSRISFDFRVDNPSAQTALLPRVVDTPPAWLCSSDDDVSAALTSADGHQIAAELAPGASLSFSAEFTVCGQVDAGPQENSAAVRWNDLGDDRNEANQLYEHIDTHAFDVALPTITIEKTPTVELPGVIDQTDPLGATRTGSVALTVTNSAMIEAVNLLVTEVLPATLEYEIGSATATWSGPTSNLNDVSAAAEDPVFTDPAPHASTVELIIERLGAGESVTIDIPIKQNGILPEPQTVIGEATLTAGNLPEDPVNHVVRGAYEVLPLEPSARVTKSSDPVGGGIGETATFTIDVLLQGSLFDIRDVVIRDILPDGLEPADEPSPSPVGAAADWVASSWSAQCIDGDPDTPGDDCDRVEFIAGYLGSRTEADPTAAFDVDAGETELQWFIGDFTHPGGTTPTQDTIVRIVYTARVRPAFANGDAVVNGADNEPLRNVAKTHFNRDDERGGLASGDLVNGWEPGLIDPTDRDRRSARASVEFDIDGPIIDFTKRAEVGDTNVTVSGLTYGILGDISLVDVGDTITYTVTVTNSGDGAAHDIVVSDDLALGTTTLLPASIDAPSGVTCTPTGASPDTLECTIEEIAPGGSIDIRYDVIAPLSADLTDNPMQVINTVRVVEFFENAASEGHRYTQGDASIRTFVYAPNPAVSVRFADGPACFTGANPGDTLTFHVGVAHAPFFPQLSAAAQPTTAMGHEPELTVEIPASMSVDPTAILATGPLGGDASHTEWTAFPPDTVTTNGDGSTTLVWTEISDVPHATVDQLLLAIETTIGDPTGSPFATATLVYEDEVGNTTRGANVNAFAEYEAFDTPHCGGGGGGGGPRPQDHGVSKTPDATQDVKLLSGTRNTFDIAITNRRSEPLTGVALSDTLPQGIRYLGADEAAPDHEVATITPLLPGDLELEDFYTGTVTHDDGSSTITWSGLPDLPTGSWTIEFPVKGDSSIDHPETFHTNTFTLQSDQGPRTDTGDMFVSHLIDPIVTKTSDAPEYAYDELVTYTVEVVIPADYQGRDLRLVDYINTSLGNNAYVGNAWIGRHGHETYAEAPVKFENFVSAECVSGCNIDDPDNPGNPDPDFVIEPEPLTPLPLATTIDYDPENELVPDGSYAGQINQATSGAYFTSPTNQRIYYWSAQNNMIGWYLGDVDPVPAGEDRQDRVIELVYQVRTPTLGELENGYVTQYDVGAIWTPERYNGPFTTNLGRVEKYWDRTKRSTAVLHESNNNTAGDPFWETAANWNGTTGWYAQFNRNHRVVTQAIHDIHIQFPYVTMDKTCSGPDGESPIEPLLQGEARNGRCVITLTNETGAPAYHIPVADRLDGFYEDLMSQNRYHSRRLYDTPTDAISAVLSGQGSEHLTSTGTEFPLEWTIDAMGPHATIDLEYSFAVDGWSELNYTPLHAVWDMLGHTTNTVSMSEYRMVDDPESTEVIAGTQAIAERIDFPTSQARITTWPHAPQKTDILPHITPPTHGWGGGAIWAESDDPLMPPSADYIGGNHPWWNADTFQRSYLGAQRSLWCVDWAVCNQRTDGLMAAAGTGLLDDDAWSSSMVAKFNEPYTWNINLIVSRIDLLQDFSITNTLPYGWNYVPGSSRIIDGDWILEGGTNTSPDYRTIPLDDPSVAASAATTCSAPYGEALGEQLDWTFTADDPGPRPIWDLRYLDRRDSVNHTTRDAHNWILIQFDAIPTFDTTDCDADQTTGRHIFMENQVGFTATPIDSNAAGQDFIEGQGYDVSTGLSGNHTMIAPVGFPVSLSKTPDGAITPDDRTTEFVIEFANNGDFDLANKVLTDTMVLTNGWDSLHVCGTATFERQQPDGTVAPATGVEETSCIDSDNADGNSQIDFTWSIDNLAVDEVVRITIPLTVPDKDAVPQAISNATMLTNSVTVDLPEYDTTLTDTGDIQVRFPSPPPWPGTAIINNSRPTINERSGYRVQFTMPARQSYVDLLYTDTIPDGLDFEGFGAPFCNIACPFDASKIEFLDPVDNGDGTTTIGWWFDDVSSSATHNVAVYLPYNTRVRETYFDGSPISPEHGIDHGPLANNPFGFAHEEDLLDAAPSPVDATVTDPPEDSDSAGGSTFFYRRGPGRNSIYVVAPRLEITKTAVASTDPDPATGTATIDYEIQVHNSGGQPAYNVTLEDIPGEALENAVATFKNGSSFFVDAWTEEDPRMAWYITQIPNGWTLTFRYTAEVVDDFANIPLTNAETRVRTTGHLGLPALVPAPGDRLWPASDWVTTSTPLAGPDIQVEKYILGSPEEDCTTTTTKIAKASTSDPSTWCLRISNDGATAAVAVDVIDELPTGWIYQAGSSTLAGASAPAEPTVDVSEPSTMLRWEIGDVGPGDTVVIAFDASPETGAPVTVTNQAIVISYLPDGDDPDPAPDPAPPGLDGYTDRSSASATLGSHGLQIAKSATRRAEPIAEIGGPVEWTIEVTNPFEDVLTDLVVTDFLPSDFTYVAGTATSASVGFDELAVVGDGPGGATAITWTIDELAGNESVSITLPSTLDPGVTERTVTNLVEATAREVIDPVLFQAPVDVYPVSTIGDVVWADANHNGVRDPGEPGLDGVEVSLRDPAGNQLYRNPETGIISVNPGDDGLALRATTGDDPSTAETEAGHFLIGGVRPGSYVLHVATPDGHTPTFRALGPDPTRDSDIDPATAMSGVFTVEPAVDNLDVDAGFVVGAAGSITGTTWGDDGNGTRNIDEATLAGVNVTLLTEDGTVLRSETTGPDGGYAFANLPPGTYEIEFTTPLIHGTTRQNVGDEAADSDIDQETGRLGLTLGSGASETVDAGFVEHASISGRSWADANADGVRDLDETDLSGVEVTLVDDSGSEVATRTTEADGTYAFTSLFPGEFVIRFGPPSDVTFTFQDRGDDSTDSDANRSTGSATRTVVAGELEEDVDAGFVPATFDATNAPTISGRAWLDDTDGIRDAGEPPVEGITVTLATAAGEPLDTTTTDLDGMFLFADVPPRAYLLVIDTPLDSSLTFEDRGTDDTIDSDIDRSSGDRAFAVTSDDVTIDVGIVNGAAGTVSGITWIDDDGDGQRAEDDPTEPNVVVTLVNPAGEPVLTATTSATGGYVFDDVPPGTYTMRFDPPEGHRVTAQTAAGEPTDSDPDQTTGTATVTVLPGESVEVDAGFVPAGSISGFAFVDSDANGMSSNDADRVGELTVRLLRSPDDEVAVQTTDMDGMYRFANLVPGDYLVEFATPEGHLITNPDAGDDDLVDSDTATADGRATVSLSAGSDVSNVDAGFVPEASVTGTVWIDDGDGRRQPGETLRADIIASVRAADNEIIAEAATAADGTFVITGLHPGTYSVEIEVPATHTPTFADIGLDDAVDSDVSRTAASTNVELGVGANATIDAGLVLGVAASISGRTWIDSESDGLAGNDEAPQTGVLIELLSESNDQLASTTVDADGSYSFTAIPAGPYVLRFVPPVDRSVTFQDQGTDDSVDSDVDRSDGTVAIELVDTDLEVDAGFVVGQPSRIVGVAWTDDGNGLRNDEEPGHVGVVVRLLTESGDFAAETTTDPDGAYVFSSVPPGAHLVEFETPSNHLVTIAGAGDGTIPDSDIEQDSGRALIVVAPATVATVDAGFVKEVSISGIAWFDDADGTRQPAEALAEGTIVHLVDDDVIDTTTTGPDGTYTFTEVFPGEYEVAFEAPDEHAITFANLDDDRVDSDPNRSTARTQLTAVAGASHTNIDVGFLAPPLTSIHGTSWIDDGDGIRFDDEERLAGLIVTLHDEDGNPLETTATSADGQFVFLGIPHGSYVVEIGTPAGFILTLRGQGEDNRDSDLHATTSRTTVVVSEAALADVGAGFVLADGPAAISGRYWHDTNADGLQNDGEPGLSDVTVRLFDDNDALVLTTMTDADGEYAFPNLPPGVFVVEFPSPADRAYGWPDRGDDTVDSDVDRATARSARVETSAGTTTVIDAGAILGGPGGTIAGSTWIDDDLDGLRGNGETGVPTSTIVRLIDPTTSAVLATAEPGDDPSTAAIERGWYVFDHLPPGSYAIAFATASDLVLSPPADPLSPDPTSATSPIIDVLSGAIFTVDAGYSAPAAIHGSVWLDSDRSGTRSDGEEAVGGVTVRLLGPSTNRTRSLQAGQPDEVDAPTFDQLVATTETDASGSFTFSGLLAGNYRVAFDLADAPPGTRPTARFVGNDERIDSDANTDGASDPIRTEPGETVRWIDLGLLEIADQAPPAIAFTGAEPISALALAVALIAVGFVLVQIGRGSRRKPIRRVRSGAPGSE